MIKHLFSDMDGTLLNPAGQVTAATAAALKAANLPLTLVSARAPMEMLATIEALKLTGPQIGFNGGLIFKAAPSGWTTISARTIPLPTARQLLLTLAEQVPALSISFYDQNRWYAPRQDEGIRFEARLTGQTPVIAPLTTLLAQPALQVFKIMMIAFDKQVMHQAQTVVKALALPNIKPQQSGAAYLEITSDEALKSRGIAYLMNQLNLTQAEVAGFGDGHNDLPMLNMMGLPVVMANAAPAVKAVAAYLTKSNAEDGVAYALQHCADLRPRRKEA